MFSIFSVIYLSLISSYLALSTLKGNGTDAAAGGDASSASGGNAGGHVGSNSDTHTHTHTHIHTRMGCWGGCWIGSRRVGRG